MLGKLLTAGSVCLTVALSSARADVVLDEDLEIDGSVYTNLTENYSGTGGIRVTGGMQTNRLVAFSGYLTNSVEGSAMVISNAFYREVELIRADADGSSMLSGRYNVVTHRRDHLGYSTFECQRHEREASAELKTLYLKLTQVGANVVVTYGPSCQYLLCKAVTNDVTGVVTAAKDVAAKLVGVLDYYEGGSDKLTPYSFESTNKWNYVDTKWGGTFAYGKNIGGGYGILNPVFRVKTAVRSSNIPGYLKSTATCIFTNAYYLNVRPVEGRVRGGTIGESYLGKLMTFCHRRDYVRTATTNPYSTYQAQFAEGSFVKTVFMKIEQRDDDVYVYAENIPNVGVSSRAAYTDGFGGSEAASAAVGNYDCQNRKAYPGTVISSGSLTQSDKEDGKPNAGYGMTNITFVLDNEAVRISGENTYSGATVADGAYLVADGDGGFTGIPQNGSVTATNGGVFAMNTYSVSGNYTMFNADVIAALGGYVRLYGMWNTSGNTRLTVDGGVFDSMNIDNYINGIVLRNGGELAGLDREDRWFRLGDSGMQPYGYKLVRSEGIGTNLVSGTLTVYRSGGDYISFDTESPLLVTGGLLVAKDTPDTYTCHVFYKRLAGDLILRGRTTNWAEWRLLEGATRLEASDTLWISNSLYLAGGDLLCGAATSNGVEKLSVNGSAQTFANRWSVAADAGGTVTFEPGSKLTVAEKGTDWPAIGANRITLAGELTNGNFRIGTTACLTASELLAFRYEDADGKSFLVRQDADGYILCGTRAGTMILIR